MQINYNHLHYFHVVAIEGSLRAASRVLGVTQSTISEQVKQLESVLGVSLFERRSGGMQLTGAGRAALDHTRVMFRAGRHLVERFQGSQVPENRVTLEVGVGAAVARSFAVDYLLPLFFDEQVFLRIRYGEHDYLVRDLVGHELDMLITDTLPDALSGRGIVSQVVHEPTLIAVASPALKREIQRFPDDLDGKRMVRYTLRSKYRMATDTFLRDAGVEPVAAGEVDDVGLQVAAAAAHPVFAIVPKHAAQTAIDARELAELGVVPTEDSDVRALYHRQDTPQIVVRALAMLRGEDDPGMLEMTDDSEAPKAS